MPAKILEKLIIKTRFLFKEAGKILDADSTGMELDHASANYCKIIDRKNPVKGFVNFNMICDTENQNILAVKTRKKRKSDFSDFKPMFNKVKN